MSADTDYADEGKGGPSFLVHLPTILWQRKWLFIIPAIILSIAGVAAAYLLPTTYRSTAILLVESPQLPVEIAGLPATDVIDQRVAKVRQQVLSRPDLIEMIQRLDLYSKERATDPLSEVITKLRSDVSFEPVSAELQRRGNGRSTTIAFSMSFDYSEASKAQAVAQDIVDKILQSDSTKNAEQAANTVLFLTDQANELQTQIALLQSQISGIKARNGSTLSNSGVTMLGGGGGNYDAQIAALQRDNTQLNNQRDLLKTADKRDPLVANAEAALAGARAVYSENHPDVAIARQRLAEAKELAKKNVKDIPTDTITSQLAFNNSQIAALQAAKARDSAQTSAILSAQSKAPVVMEQVAQLQQRLEGLNFQYQGVSQKLMTADAAAKMETEQKGERLRLVEPPVVPDQPSSPNRPRLIIGGIAAGLAAGLVLALAVELFYRPIRGLDAVTAITGTAPLIGIPTIARKRKPLRRWVRMPWPFRRRKTASNE
ncbi:MAG: GumC family protein [Sphingomonadaceae bacterium]